jgi:hydroxyacyl-ACP dehydratase HTD2-like protein with hotdog domain
MTGRPPGQLRYADIAVGRTWPPRTVVPTTVQLFLFSAATGNPHRIHYDRTYAVEVEGHRDLVVHGPLLGALLAATLADWMGPATQLVRISLQNRASAYVDRRLRIEAAVTGKREDGGRKLIDLDVSVSRDDGVVCVPGTAVICLPG